MLISIIQPYVYNQTSQILISYDNTKSMGKTLSSLCSTLFDLFCSSAAKGNFAQKNGLEGVTMWTVAGDYDDLLINSVRKGLGIEEFCVAGTLPYMPLSL